MYTRRSRPASPRRRSSSWSARLPPPPPSRRPRRPDLRRADAAARGRADPSPASSARASGLGLDQPQVAVLSAVEDPHPLACRRPGRRATPSARVCISSGRLIHRHGLDRSTPVPDDAGRDLGLRSAAGLPRLRRPVGRRAGRRPCGRAVCHAASGPGASSLSITFDTDKPWCRLLDRAQVEVPGVDAHLGQLPVLVRGRGSRGPESCAEAPGRSFRAFARRASAPRSRSPSDDP